MNISLCMIVKDEEKMLPHSLKSVKDYVDEIIIVDTGSTDNTVAVALDFGAKVYHRKWENNFATARNDSIKRAKGDWILILDADEILDNGELLLELVKEADKTIDGYLLNIYNYSDENKTHMERNAAVRLFRNRSDMRFFGAIHEQLPIKNKRMAMTNLIIHHYGYIPFISQTKSKSKRNITILLEEVKKYPDNAFVYYNLGGEYARIKQYEQAFYYYKEALKRMDEPTGYEARLYKMIGIVGIQSKKWKETISVINQGIKKFPDYPDLYYVRGLLYDTAGNEGHAIADFKQCLAMKQQKFKGNNIYVIEDGITSYKAQYALGNVFEKKGQSQEAINAYASALKSNLKFKEPFIKLKRLFSNHQHLIKFLEEKILTNNENIHDRLNLAQLLYDIDDYLLSLALLRKSNENNLQLQHFLLKGLNYFHLNQFAKAIEFFSKIKKQQEEYSIMLPYLVVSLWMSGKTYQAKQLLAKASDPGNAYKQTAALFLTIGENKLKKGINRFPESNRLEEAYRQIQRMKGHVKQ